MHCQKGNDLFIKGGIDLAQQQTIQNEGTMSGKGLMFGEAVQLTLKPAPPDHGIVFCRTDLSDAPEIKVCPENCSTEVPRCTSLHNGDVTVSSVEHLLSALAGLGVDNAKIELNAPEPPAADGSALPFVELIMGAEIVVQDLERQTIEFVEPVGVDREDKQLILLPSDQLEVTCVYDHPNLPSQVATLLIDPETYVSEIAPARSFCFADEIELLKSQGIGKGASYDNVVVIEADGGTSASLRFENEFVRHKILDLIGDLYLAGQMPKARIVAMRSGHALHAELVQSLAEKGLIGEQGVKQSVEVLDIYRVLPHRQPFCMVDRVTEFEDGKYAIGIKNVTYNEDVFKGHFPQQPVMPGVHQIEALAQLGAWLVLQEQGIEGQIGYFARIGEARFLRPVIPGDQLRLEVEVIWNRRQIARIGGKAYVGEELATETELTIALEREQAK